MNLIKSNRVHLIVGGFPVGATAGHDMDFARLRLLQMLSDEGMFATTVSSDFGDIDKWLSGCQLLVTYVAGPFPDADQCAFINDWLQNGGRWLALHGTSGGKAARDPVNRRRKMVKMDHHKTLGGFFLNHPPLRRFSVTVSEHPLTEGVPSSFDITDELYLIEPQNPDLTILLTAELEKDPSPEDFGFDYDEDTSLQSDGKTRILGYLRTVGKGGVIYYGLGHCHSPTTGMSGPVDTSVNAEGAWPATFRGPWDTEAFQTLLRNAIRWSTTAE